MLWEHYDNDGSGFISLQEIQPAAFEALQSFRRCMELKYGAGPLGVIRCWLNCLDTDGSNQLDVEEFATAAKRLGYEGDAAFLFHCLQPDAGKRFLTLDDIDGRAHSALQRGEDKIYGIVRDAQPKKELSNFIERQNNTSSKRAEKLAKKQRELLAKQDRKKVRAEIRGISKERQRWERVGSNHHTHSF